LQRQHDSEKGRVVTIHETTITPYENVRSSIQTGDIVLFHGLDLESEIIEFVELSMWSHVGIVVRMPCIEYPLLWESTPLHYLTDPLLHKTKSGPRLVSLDDRLVVSQNKGLYNRFLVRCLEVKRCKDMLNALSDFISEVHLMTFPKEWVVLRDFLEGRLLKSAPAIRRSFYCSELVAETYIRMGLLPKTPPSNAYLPKDFASRGHLPLQMGAKLGKDILIAKIRNDGM
jgi:hypothetical protein